MADLYSKLQQYEKNQATKFPTSGTIVGIDGGFVDVSIGTTILRNVRVIGTPTASGQQVVLTWENSIPTAHVPGGSSSSSVALVRGPAGPQGEQGPTGPAGAQGPKGDPGGVLTPAEFTELSSTPPTPAAGTLLVYPKTDHKMYKLSSDGTEEEIGSGSPGPGGYPPLYFTGFRMTNNASDANNDIDLDRGDCRDAANSANIDLASALTKRLDASWVVGNNQGGLFTGTKAINTWYHLFVIKRSDTGVVDAGFDTSIMAVNRPAAYDKYRLIGSIKTDGSGNIVPFYNYANRFMWKSPTRDIANTTKTLTLFTANVPPGRKVLVLGTAAIVGITDGASIFIYDPDQPYNNPSNYSVTAYANTATDIGMSHFQCLSNTSAQLYRLMYASSGNPLGVWDTMGWEEQRAS